MKRFHVHVSVNRLVESIGFYTKLFGTGPSVTKTDYAKWMLDDPRVNFAISERGHASGVNHLGLQVDSGDELTALRQSAERAELGALDEMGAACCYTKSDKYWVRDPQGIRWEAFYSLDSIPVFGVDAGASEKAAARCVPRAAVSAGSGCCG